MRVQEVACRSGPALRAWRHGRPGAGYPVLGVGAVPEMWPSLFAPAAGFAVHGWYPRAWHPGRTAASRRVPVTLDEHVADAVAVLDAAGVRRCVLVGWSVGATVAASLALTHPRRVAAVLLVAGVPGATVRTGALPEPLRAPVVASLTQGLRLGGPLLDAVLPRVPVSPALLWPLLTGASPAGALIDTARAVRCFLRRDWDWFTGMALACAAAGEPDLRGLRCPVTVLTGRADPCTDLRAAARRLAGVAQARLRILDASALLPLEQPDLVLAELHALQHRAAAVEKAVRAVRPGALTSGSRVAT